MDLEEQIRDDLTTAMRRRDTSTVPALRSILGTIANAEAVSADDHDTGLVIGRGVEVARASLSEEDRHEIIRADIASLATAASEYRELARPDHATRLDEGAQVLSRYLPET